MTIARLIAFGLLTLVTAGAAQAQVGTSLGVVDANTAADAEILSIPGAGPRMAREFKEYRPWKTKAQFEKEIGKYVGAREVARLWRYVVIE